MNGIARTGAAMATAGLTVQLGEREVLRELTLQLPRGRWRPCSSTAFRCVSWTVTGWRCHGWADFFVLLAL